MLLSKVKDINVTGLSIITLTGHSIERVSEYKYLGIWLDQKFTFRFHIYTPSNKLRQKIGFLYRHRTNFPLFSRKRVIEAVFLSVLDYGDVIYRNASASTLAALNPIYYSAIRFITGDSYLTHHCVLYENVGWAPLALRRDRHWLLFIYKALIGKMPSYITSLLNRSHTRFSTLQVTG